MNAENLVGTIYAMIALNATNERIIGITRRAFDAAVAGERERCAEIALALGWREDATDAMRVAATSIAAAIRDQELG